MILVAIGANLPGHDGATPLQTCAEAPCMRLRSCRVCNCDQYLVGTRRSRCRARISRITSTAWRVLQRMPGAAISPEDLLAALQAIEVRFGRRRSEPNAARTLDLDLIDVDGLVRETPDPILPHPRTHQRAFVLLPLLDVAPDWVHPGIGRTGRALLNAVDQSGVRLLVPSPPSGNHIQVPRLQPR